ncbi:MAG: sigma-70 family RNA polymerase sigma factor [Oscillospiraceae bacterium]|nr:sigma-70 family RNA polymerase sigma factor [Oscillospiraceae bacterium]
MFAVLYTDDFIRRTVEDYADMITRIAFQNVKNHCDAEDIMQEVFVRLMRGPEFKDESHKKAWLIRVTLNLCKNWNSTYWNRNTVPLEAVLREAEAADARESVPEELWELPPSYRSTLYLYYYEGYSVPEIAQIFGRSKNTISSWLTRARRQLKTLILEGQA